MDTDDPDLHEPLMNMERKYEVTDIAGQVSSKRSLSQELTTCNYSKPEQQGQETAEKVTDPDIHADHDRMNVDSDCSLMKDAYTLKNIKTEPVDESEAHTYDTNLIQPFSTPKNNTGLQIKSEPISGSRLWSPIDSSVKLGAVIKGELPEYQRLDRNCVSASKPPQSEQHLSHFGSQGHDPDDCRSAINSSVSKMDQDMSFMSEVAFKLEAGEDTWLQSFHDKCDCHSHQSALCNTMEADEVPLMSKLKLRHSVLDKSLESWNQTPGPREDRLTETDCKGHIRSGSTTASNTTLTFKTEPVNESDTNTDVSQVQSYMKQKRDFRCHCEPGSHAESDWNEKIKVELGRSVSGRSLSESEPMTCKPDISIKNETQAASCLPNGSRNIKTEPTRSVSLWRLLECGPPECKPDTVIKKEPQPSNSLGFSSNSTRKIKIEPPGTVTLWDLLGCGPEEYDQITVINTEVLEVKCECKPDCHSVKTEVDSNCLSLTDTVEKTEGDGEIVSLSFTCLKTKVNDMTMSPTVTKLKKKDDMLVSPGLTAKKAKVDDKVDSPRLTPMKRKADDKLVSPKLNAVKAKGKCASPRLTFTKVKTSDKLVSPRITAVNATKADDKCVSLGLTALKAKKIDKIVSPTATSLKTPVDNKTVSLRSSKQSTKSKRNYAEVETDSSDENMDFQSNTSDEAWEQPSSAASEFDTSHSKTSEKSSPCSSAGATSAVSARNRYFFCHHCNLGFRLLRGLQIHISLCHTMHQRVTHSRSGRSTESSHFAKESRKFGTGKSFTCDKCGKKLGNGKSFACDKCSKTFTHPALLKAHKTTHTNPKPDSYIEILKKFRYVPRQEKTNSDNASLVCEICSMKFDSPASLTIHKATHAENKSFSCDVCGKTFSQAVDRKEHKLRMGHKLFVCSCGVVCGHASALDRHQEICVLDKAFVCEECGETCASAADRTEHKIKTGHTPFMCETCGMSFMQVDDLKKHKVQHEPIQLYCDVCGKGFLHLEDLKLHKIRTGHRGRDNGCDARGMLRTRTSDSKLKGLTLIRTCKNRLICDVCDKTFLCPGDLKEHRIQMGHNPYVCSACGKAFAAVHEFRDHELIHGARRVACEKCAMTFKTVSNLKNHMKTHYSFCLKNFECPACQTIFMSSHELRRHRISSAHPLEL